MFSEEKNSYRSMLLQVYHFRIKLPDRILLNLKNSALMKNSDKKLSVTEKMVHCLLSHIFIFSV